MSIVPPSLFSNVEDHRRQEQGIDNKANLNGTEYTGENRQLNQNWDRHHTDIVQTWPL
jgi:hypothetical protein